MTSLRWIVWHKTGHHLSVLSHVLTSCTFFYELNFKIVFCTMIHFLSITDFIIIRIELLFHITWIIINVFCCYCFVSNLSRFNLSQLLAILYKYTFVTLQREFQILLSFYLQHYLTQRQKENLKFFDLQ